MKRLFRDFVKYVSLNVLGMIGLSCYILADTFFVSKGLGTDGLTALNLAIPVYSFVNGCGMMLGMGGASKYTIFRTQGKGDKCNEVFTHSVYFAVIFSVIFVAVGLLFSQNIAVLLGADGEILAMTNTYLKVILLFSPAFIINGILNCFVRNDGNPNLAMLGMLIGSFANIVFDYIFIFPMNMGIFGAVLATGFSPVFGMLIMSVHFIRRKNGFRFTPSRFNSRVTADIFALGVPSLITELSSGVVIIVFNMLVLNLEGNVGVAGYGVIANTSLVIISVYTGIAQGMQPVASRAYGSGDLHNARRVLRYAVITTVVVSIAVYAVVFVFAGEITAIFNSENNVRLQEIAVNGMRIYFSGIFFAGFNIVMSMFFVSTERAVPAQTISVSRGFAVIIPLAFVLAYLLKITGVWLTFPTAEFLVLILAVIMYCR